MVSVDRSCLVKGGQLIDVSYELFAKAKLCLGLLAQRDSQRVAQTVNEQTSNADTALDTPVLTSSRLGDSEVQRVVPV